MWGRKNEKQLSTIVKIQAIFKPSTIMENMDTVKKDLEGVKKTLSLEDKIYSSNTGLD